MSLLLIIDVLGTISFSISGGIVIIIRILAVLFKLQLPTLYTKEDELGS